MKRVLVFNFFGGLMDRGIPLYTADVIACLKQVGFHPIELRCPGWLRPAPRAVRNLMFVMFEQLVAPVMRAVRGCALTVYPYNSAGMIDAALGRSVLVIHDLIGNDRTNARLAARYIRSTQAFHRRMRAPVCAASMHTLKHVRRLQAFDGCTIRLWTNPFYSFEAALAQHQGRASERQRAAPRILLCSGLGPNKDFRGALRLFAASEPLRDAELHVIGFGDDAHVAERWVRKLPEPVRRRINVLPRLTLQQVVSEYDASDFVWVHSLKEGFGRSVVEARLAGRPVVANDIGAFRRLKDEGVALYRKNSFDSAVACALTGREPPRASTAGFHKPLEKAVRQVTGRYFRARRRAAVRTPAPALGALQQE